MLLHGVTNSFEYLIELQRHAIELTANPARLDALGLSRHAGVRTNGRVI